MAQKAIASPVPISWYPTLSVLMLAIGLVITASFFMQGSMIPLLLASFLEVVGVIAFGHFSVKKGELE